MWLAYDKRGTRDFVRADASNRLCTSCWEQGYSIGAIVNDYIFLGRFSGWGRGKPVDPKARTGKYKHRDGSQCVIAWHEQFTSIGVR